MSNNKQQTAVDILCGKLAMKLGIPQAITFYIDHQEEIREAKEMEKERMIQFAKQCLDKALDLDVRTAYLQVEKYYNTTYGGNK
jgi:hypothetical protein